jgi:hypothetical protein
VADVVVLARAALHAWPAFREGLLPMTEIEKIWPEFQASRGTLPEREQRNQVEVLALVQEILDSNVDKRADILSGTRTEMKILLAFRLLRAGEFLKHFAAQSDGVYLPEEIKGADSVQPLLRYLVLH